MPEFRDRGSGRRNQFWVKLERISSDEAYSCNLRQTIRADTRRSSCHLQRSHPWGPTFHCCSAYNSQTHCNLQGREWKTPLWVVHDTYTKKTDTQICRWSVADSDVLSCLVSISWAKLISPCNQTLKEATAAWNRNTEEKKSPEDGKIGRTRSLCPLAFSSNIWMYFADK